MADLQKIADDLSGLTVLEASELTKILEEKWGVSAAAPVAVAAAPGGQPAGDAGASEEKTESPKCIEIFASCLKYDEIKIHVVNHLNTCSAISRTLCIFAKRGSLPV